MVEGQVRPDGAEGRIAGNGQNHPHSKDASMNTTRDPSLASCADHGGLAPFARPQETLPLQAPPGRGAPDVREGGGARAGSDYPDVYVVCPAHRAWTVSAHPVLHCCHAGAADILLKITVYREDGGESNFVHHLEGPKPASVNQIDLAEHDVILEKGGKFVWTVNCFNGQSRESFSETTLERVEMRPQFAKTLAGADPSKHARIYAENGICYKALTAPARQIAKHPDDKSLRKLRSELVLDELLVQVRRQEPLEEDKEEQSREFLDTYGSLYD